LKPKPFFPPPPITGGPDAKILFLNTQRPQLHKKILSPQTSHFRGMGVKGSTFPPPQKLGGHIPSIICTGYSRDEPPNSENFVKVSGPVSEIFGIFSFY